jgi:Ca-activated chloride channel family protein
MSFLTPLALTFAALALPILALYMLKLRRRQVEVSSVMLWQRLLRDREANAPWQKLKRNLLLFLQLLVLAALALALARPFVRVPAVAAGTVVVLLDASASMNAVDVRPSRFEAARAAVRGLIDGLAPDGQMALILVGHQPEVLAPATGDKEALRTALARAHVSVGGVNWAAAVALAAGMERAGRLDQSTVVIVSDGGLPAEGLPPLPGEVRYVPIGVSDVNLALAALALRPTAQGPELFAKVANTSDAQRDVLVSIYIDNQLYTARQLTVRAQDTADLVLTGLPTGAAVYQARLSPPVGAPRPTLDDFPLDDTAWAVYQPPASARALLVSSQPDIFLEQMLASLPGLQPSRLVSGTLPAEPFDLYVFDGVVSTTFPAGDLLLVNPPQNPLFQIGDVFTQTQLVQVAAGDPLAQSVDWTNVHVLKARRVTPPAWARVLVESEGGPLVFAGETGGRRVAVLTFDLHDSDLPLQVAYPILMANLVNWLAPGQAFSAPDGLHPGDTLTLRPGRGDQALAVSDPLGGIHLVSTANPVFADTAQLGVYTVGSNNGPLGAFAVNLFDPAESSIRPAARIFIGRAAVAASPPSAVGQLEIWPWLAGAAFAVLVIEWWVYHRGATLPAVRGWRGWWQRIKAR